MTTETIRSITIPISVNEDVVLSYGKEKIRQILTEQIRNLKLIRISEEITEKIDESGIELINELETVKNQAWENYKKIVGIG
jgi:hypothetical protein